WSGGAARAAWSLSVKEGCSSSCGTSRAASARPAATVAIGASRRRGRRAARRMASSTAARGAGFSRRAVALRSLSMSRSSSSLIEYLLESRPEPLHGVAQPALYRFPRRAQGRGQGVEIEVRFQLEQQRLALQRRQCRQRRLPASCQFLAVQPRLGAVAVAVRGIHDRVLVRDLQLVHRGEMPPAIDHAVARDAEQPGREALARIEAFHAADHLQPGVLEDFLDFLLRAAARAFQPAEQRLAVARVQRIEGVRVAARVGAGQLFVAHLLHRHGMSLARRARRAKRAWPSPWLQAFGQADEPLELAAVAVGVAAAGIGGKLADRAVIEAAEIPAAAQLLAEGRYRRSEAEIVVGSRQGDLAVAANRLLDEPARGLAGKLVAQLQPGEFILHAGGVAAGW